ncbi:MAG: MarR family transcriptional regulator [Anaerolineales bacterium]
MSEKFDSLQRELDSCADVEGVTAAQVMLMPDAVRSLLNRMIRKGALTLAELQAELGLEEAEASQLAETLIAKGLVVSAQREADGATLYRVRLARTRELSLPPSNNSTRASDSS